ncbi:hypothetical protein JCM3775_005679 [Rhodotorula graminis]
MDHSGMDMGMGGGSESGGACQISMLFNWTVVDSCFLTSSWHVRSVGAFAASVIGVFFMVLAHEAVRRLGREYDRSIRTAYYRREALALAALAKNQGKEIALSAPFRPSNKEHAVRSLFYFVQFGVAYILMLLAMYFNVAILMAIIGGGGVGHFLFARDTATDASTAYEASKDECCC